jgi:flagellar hook-length control protein FliK
MNMLVNSYAVSPSGGDMRGDGLVQWAPRNFQERFPDVPSLADATRAAGSHSGADGEGDLSPDVQRAEDILSARKRDRSTEEGYYAAAAAVAPDNPAQLLEQTRDEVRQDEPASERSAKTPCDGPAAAESTNVEQKKQAAGSGQQGENGQDAQAVHDVARENGGLGAPGTGPSAPKGNPAAVAPTLDEPSQKALSGKRSRSLVAFEKSEARLRAAGLESQSRPGLKRGSASGNLNPAMEALLSRGKEIQLGGLKSGASASPGASAGFVSPPTVTGPHTSVATAPHGGAAGGVGEGIPQNMGEQILDSLRASMAQGDRQVLIRLQPPELGMVLVQLRERREGVDGTLKVDRADTRHEIEQALPEVVRSLQDAGIGIRRLDVTGSDSSGQDVGNGQPPQDGSSGYRDAGQDRDSLRTSLPTRPPAAADPLGDARQVGEIQGSGAMPQGRIDMLL